MDDRVGVVKSAAQTRPNPAEAPSPPSPPSSRQASLLDELAGIDSAGPFMERAFSDAPAAPSAAPAASPEPALTQSPPVPAPAARSPLDDISGFSGLFGNDQDAGAQMSELSPGTMDQLDSGYHLPSVNQSQESPAGGSITPWPGGNRGDDATHAAVAGISASDTMALSGDDSNPFGAPLGRNEPSRSSSLQPSGQGEPFGDKPAEGKKQTFYPMLEFGQDFRGLDDDGAEQDSRADSPPPVATRRRAEPVSKPDRSPPRTQALDFSAEMKGRASSVSAGTSGESAASPRDVSRSINGDDDDAGLLSLTSNGRTTDSRPSISDEDRARMKFDLVGDLARKSQPRTPYDSYVFGSLFLFVVLLNTVVAVAAYRNGGTFDFSDPRRMLAIARGEVEADSTTTSTTMPDAVVVGDALVENHQAAADNLFAVSSATVGRLLTESGAQLVLVEGVLTNRTTGDLRDMRMDVALVDDDGVAVTTEAALIGTDIAAGELAGFSDAGALAAAMLQAAGRVADFELQPGQSTRFSAVFFPGEVELTGLVPVVRPRSAASNASSSFATITLSGELPMREPIVEATEGSGASDGSAGTDGAQGAGELRVPASEDLQEGSGDTP